MKKVAKVLAVVVVVLVAASVAVLSEPAQSRHVAQLKTLAERHPEIRQELADASEDGKVSRFEALTILYSADQLKND